MAHLVIDDTLHKRVRLSALLEGEKIQHLVERILTTGLDKIESRQNKDLVDAVKHTLSNG